MLDVLSAEDVVACPPGEAVQVAYHFGVHAEELLERAPDGPRARRIDPLYVPDGWCTAA